MAGGEEPWNAAGAGVGGGGEEAQAAYPTGFRFKPNDEELIEFYLLPRLQGRSCVPNDFIIEANVYACHPDTLINAHRGRGEEEWYFLSPRARMYRNGVRPSRKTGDGRGRWKASTATKELAEEKVCDGRVTFSRSVLNYFEGVPKNEVRSKWLMCELTIPEYEIKLDGDDRPKNMLNEYVMCKIYVSPQHKGKDEDEEDEEEEANTSAAYGEEGASSSSSQPQHIQGAAESSDAETRAGKRPVPQEPPPPLGRRKQARQGSLTIAGPAQVGGSSNVPLVPARHYAAPAGYNAQAPPVMLRPPPPAAGAYNGPGHVVPQRPARANSGQALPQRPPGAYYHGQQAPFLRPPGGFSGLQAPMPRPPMPMQFPANSAAANPSAVGRMTTNMMRPPNPANQGFGPPQQPGTGYRPHVSLQCFYDQNYRGAQSLGTGARQQRQPAFLPPQQQMRFNGNELVGAAGPLYRGYPFQHSSMAPADDLAYAGRCDVNAEQYFVDLAVINPSLVAARPPAAPAQPPVEPPAAGATTGAANVAKEMGETSSLKKEDTA